MSIESAVMHGNEWWSKKQCPVSKSWTNMPFSRSRRSGPLSQRTPAIDSQHLTKYAPLLEKANSVYNSELTAFLKSATPTPPPLTIKSDSNKSHLRLPLVIEYLFCLTVLTWELILGSFFPTQIVFYLSVLLYVTYIYCIVSISRIHLLLVFQTYR